MTYKVVPATEPYIRELAPLLRQADKDEIMAASGMDPLNGLLYSFDNSRECYVALSRGVPVCAFGIGRGTGEGVWSPWMLGTPMMAKFAKALIRDARPVIYLWTDQYKFLANIVDTRNAVHMNWIKHMGFTFVGDPFPFGVDPNVPFQLFVKKKE